MKVGINGFGRIGRNVFRAVLGEQGCLQPTSGTGKGREEIDFVAVNDLADAKTLAHLLKYDSLFGTLDADVGFEENSLIVNGKRIKVLGEKDPANLPWAELAVEIVVE